MAKPECDQGRETGAGALGMPLEPGLRLIETRLAPESDLAIPSRIESEAPRLVLTLGLAGRSRFVGERGEEVEFAAGYTTLTSFAASRGERLYPGGRPIAQVRLTLEGDWLAANLGEATAGRLLRKPGRVSLLGHRPSSGGGLEALRQLLAPAVPEPARPLLCRGLALSLLAFELAPFMAEAGGTAPAARDLAAAQRAKAILAAEFRHPPSVRELARRVGVNEFRLKQLFHQVHAGTPYGVLLDIRMRTAYRLLESTRCPVAVAAEAVGYRHAGNFSAAFARYFGIAPKTVGRKS